MTQVIREKKTVTKILQFVRHFNMKLIPTNLIANSLLSTFYIFVQTKNNQIQKQPPEMCYEKRNVFLEISQNSQENICARVSFLIKLQAAGPRPATLLKKSLYGTGAFL